MNKVQQLIDFLGHYPRIDGRMADGKVKGYFKEYAQAAFQQLAAALDTPSGKVGFRNVHETHSGEVYFKFMVFEHHGIAVTLTWNGAHTKVAIQTIASLRGTWGGRAVLAPLTDLLKPKAMRAHFDTLHHAMPPKPSESDAPPMPMDAVRITPQGKVGWVTQAEGLPGKRALSVRVESTLYRVHEHNATVLLPANQVQDALRTDLHELATLSYERWLTLPAWTVAHNHLTRWLDGMAASPFLGKALYHRWMYQHQAVVDLATKCILVRQPLTDEALEAAHRISDFLADGSAEQKKVGRLLRHVQFRLQPDLPEPVLGDPPFRHGDQVTFYTLSGIVVDVLPTMYDQGAKWGWEFFVFGTERYASKRVNPEVMRHTTLDTRDRYITINPHWTTLNQLHDFYFIPSKWHEAAITSALEELGFQYERDPMGDFLVKGINPNLMYRMRQATKQYGLRPLPLTRQDHGPLPQSPKDNMPMSDSIAYTTPAFKFSAVTEVPRDKITLRPDLFQGRQHDFAKETVDKIVREGFDKSREPIIAWKDAQGRYVVISGHSRWEASERLFEAGDTGLKTMPVKFFQGTLQDAIDFAVLESNRDGTQEGLKSDLQAYRRAIRQGRNREFLQGIFKPENRLRLLEDIVSLDEDGTWMRYLDTSAEKHFPYLQRNAAWVGQLRKQLPELTHRHEHELFEYLYAIKDGKTTGKQRLLITKDQLFSLVEKRVARTDFTPERPLNLAALPSTSAVTEPQRERMAEVQAEIDRLARERAEKDDLIATATASQEFELVGKFKRRQSAINALITEKKLEIATLQQAIGKLEANTIDLFTAPDAAPDTPPPTDEIEALESMLASLGEASDEAPSNGADEADEGMAALDALMAELDVEAPPANRSDVDGEAAPGESAKRPPTDSQDLLHLLTDGHYFAQHPENVLGELYDFKNPWGQLEKRVRMTGDGGVAQFDHLKRFLPAPSDPLAAPSASDSEALNPTERLRVEQVLTQAVKAEQADQEKVILGVNREACPEGSHCFEDVLAKFNEGIVKTKSRRGCGTNATPEASTKRGCRRTAGGGSFSLTRRTSTITSNGG
ncbi:MAG: ParB N-terminal domain-containing protein [Bacteroidota bacterium]